jgi:hypothetical protein
MGLNHFLNRESKTLAPLLKKLRQLEQWNAWLRECLMDDTLAKHCYIANLDKTALIVMVDSAHWSTRLKFNIPTILKKIQTYPGLETVRAICCKTYPAHFSPRKKIHDRPSVLSSKTAETILEIAEKIEDKQLKDILQKIALNTEDLCIKT